MHAKHDDKDAKQGKTVKESEKARKNPTQAGHGLVGAARTATWAHSSRVNHGYSHWVSSGQVQASKSKADQRGTPEKADT
jgi:hypothetical protein